MDRWQGKKALRFKDTRKIHQEDGLPHLVASNGNCVSIPSERRSRRRSQDAMLTMKSPQKTRRSRRTSRKDDPRYIGITMDEWHFLWPLASLQERSFHCLFLWWFTHDALWERSSCSFVKEVTLVWQYSSFRDCLYLVVTNVSSFSDMNLTPRWETAFFCLGVLRLDLIKTPAILFTFTGITHLSHECQFLSC